MGCWLPIGTQAVCSKARRGNSSAYQVTNHTPIPLPPNHDYCHYFNVIRFIGSKRAEYISS